MTRILIIESEPDAVCELCGRKEETRPYGTKKPDGTRYRVCFACAMINESEAAKAFSELVDGEAPQ